MLTEILKEPMRTTNSVLYFVGERERWMVGKLSYIFMGNVKKYFYKLFLEIFYENDKTINFVDSFS